MKTFDPKNYSRGNLEAAGLILADPEAAIGWPEPMTVEEIDASLAVKVSKKTLARCGASDVMLDQAEEAEQEFKLA